MEKLDIMLVGVGGQGTLLASRVLGTVALKLGFDVKVSEVHGMSQRGGSVVTYVKMGKKIHSPLIEKGEADIILAFEKLEAYRWMEFLNKGGKMIVNMQKINPMPVIIGKAVYPENITEKMQEKDIPVLRINALKLARESGNIKAVNIVLLGMMAVSAGIPKEIWQEAMKEVIPPKLLEVNVKAFEAGYNAGMEA